MVLIDLIEEAAPVLKHMMDPKVFSLTMSTIRVLSLSYSEPRERKVLPDSCRALRNG